MVGRFVPRIVASLTASVGFASPIHAQDASNPLASKPVWTVEGDQLYSNFGGSAASAGDVNGDGYADVVVGARFYKNGESFEGRAFVYFGSAKGLPFAPAWIAGSDPAMGQFGACVASAGDVNGDGFSDVIIGAPYFHDGKKGEGGAFLYLGSANGLALEPAWHAESHQKFAHFGSGVAGAGDVNGDGFVDVLVGAPEFHNGETDEGRVFLYLGSKADLGHPAAWITESNDSTAGFGYSVSSAGDVNADGFSDIILGAFVGGGGKGLALVYVGSTVGLGPSPAWTAKGNQEFADFGFSVATAGDVDSDGYSDIIVGAPGFDNGESGEGRAFLYRGSAAGVATLTPAWTAEGDQAAASFGGSVGTAGDVNGDGFSDVIVGAFRFDDGETNEGRAYAYVGSAAGLALAPAWTAEGDQSHTGFAVSVGTAGDVNGDGFSDVVVGAYEFDDFNPQKGRAFVYLGAPPASAFIPGDRLHGAFTAQGDYTAAAFDGIVGMKVGLEFDGTPSPMTIRLQLLAADGSVAKQSIVNLGAKNLKKTLNLKSSGPFTLRWNLLSGTPGTFDITTSRTLPAPPNSTILKPKTDNKTTASLALLALPGALLDVTLTKQKFTGTIGVSMTRPDNTTYDVSSYTTTAADGSVTLAGVPCEIVGAYKLIVRGYSNSNETVKAKVKVTPPAPGNADVSLP